MLGVLGSKGVLRGRRRLWEGTVRALVRGMRGMRTGRRRRRTCGKCIFVFLAVIGKIQIVS